MMITRVDRLFSLVESVLSPKTYEIVLRIFLHHDAAIEVWSPSEGNVSQVLPSLKARLENALRHGVQVYGLVETVAQLERLPSEYKIVSYVVKSKIGLAVIYLHCDEQQGIGAIIPPLAD